MSDFFLELYSEEIPHNLQINAREQLDKLIKNELDEKEIKFEKFSVFSTPKRISVVINNIATEQKTNSQEVKGPRVGCNEQALEGFLNSRSVSRDDLITKDTEKGQFYYVKLEEKTIYTSQILAEKLSLILKRSNINKDEIDETIIGQVLTAGNGQNPARQASINAGIPFSKPAYIINQVCGSGLRAVVSGFQSIKLGDK